MSRTSLVHTVRAGVVSFSSIVQIGDSRHIVLPARALAVQRQLEYVDTAEFPLTFPVFTKPIPKPPVDREPFHGCRLHNDPVISVRSLRVLGVSSSSVIHIGSTQTVKTESRIKHIRQLSYGRRETNASDRRSD